MNHKIGEVSKIEKSAFKKHAYSMEYTFSLVFSVTCEDRFCRFSATLLNTRVEWING